MKEPPHYAIQDERERQHYENLCTTLIKEKNLLQLKFNKLEERVRRFEQMDLFGMLNDW